MDIIKLYAYLVNKCMFYINFFKYENKLNIMLNIIIIRLTIMIIIIRVTIMNYMNYCS